MYKLNKQGDDTQPCCTPFPILNHSVVPCPVLTIASCPACIQVFQETGKVVWYSHLFKNFPHKGFSIVSEQIFFFNPLAFSMIQQMLAI